MSQAAALKRAADREWKRRTKARLEALLASDEALAAMEAADRRIEEDIEAEADLERSSRLWSRD